VAGARGQKTSDRCEDVHGDSAVVDGAVRSAPYPAVVQLVRWVERRRNWYQFDGWCAARGLDPLALPAHRALNLIQYCIIEHVEDVDQRRRIVDELTGPLLTDERRRRQLAEQAPDEPPMPSWWDDDEDASASSIAAARQLGM